MNFLLDHDVPEDLVRILLREAHHVVRLAEVLERTAPDSMVFAYAKEHGLILITCNRDDFLKFVNDAPHAGMIILIRRRFRSLECAKILTLLRHAGNDGLANNVNFA